MSSTHALITDRKAMDGKDKTTYQKQKMQLLCGFKVSGMPFKCKYNMPLKHLNIVSRESPVYF